MEKKLLFVASSASHIRQFHLPYLKQFREEGWTVHAACGFCSGDIPHAHRTISLPLKKSMFAFGNFRAAARLRRLIKEEAYHAVFLHTSLAAFFARLALIGLRRRPKVVNTVHGYLFDHRTNALKRLLLLGAERLTAGVTDLVITMNSYDHTLAKKYRLGAQVSAIPGMGVDFSRLDSRSAENLRQKLGIREDTFLLLYAAEFSRRKNQQELLRAMAGLPEKTVLALPGDGGNLKKCKALAEKLGIAHRVFFPGFAENMGDWYAIADAVISTSRSEGLPFHIMEAMHFGLPIIASEIKGHTDLLTRENTGLLYPSGDVPALRAAILRLMDEPSLCRHSGTAANAYALAQVLPQIMAHYRRITDWE